MNVSKDKIKYQNLIDRANKIGFRIPEHWLKYGYPPSSHSEIVAVYMDAYLSDAKDLFNTRYLYDYFKKIKT